MTVTPQTICSVCVMDTTDPEIQFLGEEGCNHCKHARYRVAHDCFPGADGERRLRTVIQHIKDMGEGKRYDCAVGLSGGVDSSYVLYRAVSLGLRPLAIHIDNGWNSELAVHNIKSLVSKLGVDLITLVIDWEEIRDLQRACFRAPVMDIEIMADHAIFAGVFKEAAAHGIKFLLSGTNVNTESILPTSWAYDKRDSKHVLAIHKMFGEGVKLRTYPTLSPTAFLYDVFIKGLRFVPILNYGSYNKAQAIEILKENFDWRPYPNKHGESTFTRFFQDYYLPAKFGIDKRKAHMSSLIVSGAMTRDEALKALEKPLFQPQELASEKEYVLKKLGFSHAEWDAILAAPAIAHADLPNNAWMFNLRNPVTRWIRRVTKFETGDK